MTELKPEPIPGEELIGESPSKYLPKKLPTSVEKQRQLARVIRAFERRRVTPKHIEIAKSLKIEKPSWIEQSFWDSPHGEIDPRSNMIAYQIAWGLPDDEIAQSLGVPRSDVKTARMNDLVKLKVREIQERVFGFDPMQAIKKFVPQAIGKIAQTMNDPLAKTSTQLAAAQDIADRGLGKATQNVRVEETSLRKVFEELDRIRRVGGLDAIEVPAVTEDGVPQAPKAEEKPVVDLDPADQWIKEMYGS